MAGKQPEAFYWDSSCFVAWFSEEAGRHAACAAMIDAARKGEIRLYTSFLTLVEVIRIPHLYVAEAEDRIAEFFRNPYILKVALDWYVAAIARDLQRRCQLDARDAIHLATAIHIKAHEFQTYDNDLLDLDTKILKISLRIGEPTYLVQTKLFEQ